MFLFIQYFAVYSCVPIIEVFDAYKLFEDLAEHLILNGNYDFYNISNYDFIKMDFQNVHLTIKIFEDTNEILDFNINDTTYKFEICGTVIFEPNRFKIKLEERFYGESNSQENFKKKKVILYKYKELIDTILFYYNVFIPKVKNT